MALNNHQWLKCHKTQPNRTEEAANYLIVCILVTSNTSTHPLSGCWRRENIT